VTGVLDWELSTLGDPLTDLAHLLIYWESARGRKTHVAQDIATRPGFLDGATLAKTYSVRANRSIDGLDFYLVFEHWRAAIIKEGIYQRHLQGLQLGAEGSGQAVLGYLDEAADLAGLAS
jgi:aminoglycoside phosphotransferase (APT) family kinase protein